MSKCCRSCGRRLPDANERLRANRKRQRVAEILSMYNNMMLSQREVAKRMGVCQATVSRIVSPAL